MTPLNWLSEVSHALARVRFAADMTDLNAAVAPVGLTVTTKDWGGKFEQSRWSAVVTQQDGAEVLTAVNTDELNAAKLAAYNVLRVMQQDAVRAIEGEVQP